MNRCRIRVGQKVREFNYVLSEDWSLADVEDVVCKIVTHELNLVGFGMEYIGEYAWEILVDGNKVGHVKAWHENTKKRPDDSPSLWPIAQIAFFAYLALC